MFSPERRIADKFPIKQGLLLSPFSIAFIEPPLHIPPLILFEAVVPHKTNLFILRLLLLCASISCEPISFRFRCPLPEGAKPPIFFWIKNLAKFGGFVSGAKKIPAGIHEGEHILIDIWLPKGRKFSHFFGITNRWNVGCIFLFSWYPVTWVRKFFFAESHESDPFFILDSPQSNSVSTHSTRFLLSFPDAQIFWFEPSSLLSDQADAQILWIEPFFLLLLGLWHGGRLQGCGASPMIAFRPFVAW